MSNDGQKERSKFRESLPVILKYIILTVTALFILVPIVIIIFGALKTRGEFYTIPYIPPIPPRWGNIIEVVSLPAFWYMLRNSLVVMASTTFIVVILSCSFSFCVFAYEVPGKEHRF